MPTGYCFLDLGDLESWNHKLFKLYENTEADINFPHSPQPLPFYRCGNGGSERDTDLPGATHRRSIEASRSSGSVGKALIVLRSGWIVLSTLENPIAKYHGSLPATSPFPTVHISAPFVSNIRATSSRSPRTQNSLTGT